MKHFPILLIIASSLLSSCAIYRLDIQQGNVITQEMLDQVEVGMTEQKIIFLLGSPILIDPFHPQRWEYVYSTHPGGKQPSQRHITLFFNSDKKLQQIGGDVVSALALARR
ncbi:MAG: outer membrane protein assembly factor BamE [Thiotrichaceae bacterium]